LAEQPGLNH